jgi:four helix bundle protein
MPRDPRQLVVFRRAHELVLSVYALSAGFPAVERYGLTAQLRRAAVSIPLNIVEGCNRRSAREYQRFLDIAIGSAAETGYILDLVVDLGFMPSESSRHCRDCADHVVRELQNLQRAIGGLPT